MPEISAMCKETAPGWDRRVDKQMQTLLFEPDGLKKQRRIGRVMRIFLNIENQAQAHSGICPERKEQVRDKT